MKLLQTCVALWLSAASASDISLADAMDGKDADRLYVGSIRIQVTNPSPLHPMGDFVNEPKAKKPVPSIVNFASKLTSKEQMNVCERTQKVMFVGGETPVEASLGGPVYEECMSALEPLLREHSSKTKSTDVLNGCTGLINDLTANKQAGAETKNICSLLVDQLNPTVPPPPPKPKMALKPPSETNTLTTICALTIKSALKNVKTEADAMQLGSTVAPLCQKFAKEKLAQNATAEWCYELDGRLTLAIETGYLFALHPTQALEQANEPNPYAQETRQRFCERFVKAVEHEKSAAKPLEKIVQPASAPVPQAAQAAKLKPVSPKVATPPTKPTAVAAPAEKDMQSLKLKASNTPASVDMLGLMQQLSHLPQWNSLCTNLLGSLTSEEGAVTEEFALGDAETKAASLVLTFNAEDQSQIGKCSTKLKVLAIRSKVLGVQNSKEGHHTMSALSIAERAEIELQNTEGISALIDSPWARDACADIAHGYLVAHLAHPDLTKESFCPMYAEDLNRMRSVLTAETIRASKMPAKADSATVASELADELVKKKAAEKAQALKQLRSRQAAELAAKAKAAEEKKKLEQQQKQQKSELADAEASGSMFLKDMAVANAKNADAAEFELKHPDGDSFWSQFSQPVSKPAPKMQVPVQRILAKPIPAQQAVPVMAVAVDPRQAAKPVALAAPSETALLPVAVTPPANAQADVDSGFDDMFGGEATVPTDAAPVATAPKAADDVAGAAAIGSDEADGGDGAEFWKQSDPVLTS